MPFAWSSFMCLAAAGEGDAGSRRYSGESSKIIKAYRRELYPQNYLLGLLNITRAVCDLDS
jgi:hypothetical protein